MKLFKSIEIGQLLGKYLTGKEYKEEFSTLQEWINQNDENRKLFKSLKEEKNMADSFDEFEAINKEIAWKRYVAHVDNLSLRKLINWWKFAAVFFFLIGCAGVLGYLVEKNNLLPLKANENFTTISTNYGQNSKVILPDSSVVWVNSGTTLSYNTNFAVNNRKIKLIGQAFFHIARNEKMPLVVASNDLEIKVLGTRFDVSSYPEDKNISIVLESGSVEILKAKDHSVIQKLKPGEKAEFDTENRRLSISNVDVYNYTSWKDGVLIFKDESMTKVFEKLERKYNIDVEVKSNKVYQLAFNATIVNESIEEIFDLMKFSCAIKYTIIPSRDPNIPVKVLICK
ncbi:MAG: FecR domain-containing protein [Prolixibacteraceae bacterium]|jgi:ferric-dicitrate binding protein FerR (iron transport regulator)